MEKQRMEKQKAKEDQKDKTKAGYNMFKRLAKFLPKKISSQNNIWRISSLRERLWALCLAPRPSCNLKKVMPKTPRNCSMRSKVAAPTPFRPFKRWISSIS